MVGSCHATIGRDGKPTLDSENAIVPWWSFTKTLIAATALRLAEQGQISLDAILPGLPYTPRQILQHRAGVGNYGELPAYQLAVARGDAPWNDDQLVHHVPPDRLLFPPGTGWAYSNVGYLLLRRLIENKCGADLGQVLHELILAPLGLCTARLAKTRDDMNATAILAAHGYHPGWVFHGTVIGSVAEAALALHRLVTGNLLGEASRAAMFSRYAIGGAIPGRPWVTTGYGLGLMMGEMHHAGLATPVPVVGHSAGGPGSVGAVYHAPRIGRTVAVFMEGNDQGAAESEALLHLCAQRGV